MGSTFEVQGAKCRLKVEVEVVGCMIEGVGCWV